MVECKQINCKLIQPFSVVVYMTDECHSLTKVSSKALSVSTY